MKGKITDIQETTLRFPTDSCEYEMLERAAETAPQGPDALWLEVGTREGGSTARMMDRLKPGGHLVTVDPYGGLTYNAFGTQQKDGAFGVADLTGPIEWVWTSALEYNPEMRYKTTVNLMRLAHHQKINFVPLCMTDADFMAAFGGGVPIYWNAHRRLINSYGLVFLDGPHDTPSLLTELEFFAPRMMLHGQIIIDDHLVGQEPERDATLTDWCRKHCFMVSELGENKAVFKRGKVVNKEDNSGVLVPLEETP